MIDSKLQEDLRAKYNPDGSDLRKAQLRMVEMLKFLDKVCKENNIVYWLDSGTLIGAARHGGFIPWDDDMDVCMPLDEFKRFKDLMLNNSFSNEFVLQCHETDKNFYGQWIVLRDLKSEYLQDSKLHQMRKYRGLQIDIFPLEDTIRPFFLRFADCYIGYLINRPLLGKSFFKILRSFVPVSYFIFEKVIKLLFRKLGNSFKNNPYYQMSYGCGFSSKRYLNTIYPIGEIEFEGSSFPSPNDIDAYLTNIYGDWKRLPDKIRTHNVKFLFKNEWA